ncbi:MAG: phosphoribosylaminoimidazolesuccinocarboxamide synthase [Coriobacteriales bacterium]|jgi:phosphoribosylaminoimidazole-succinocarboxamide synthase|nr:phosphoribosylaminoimidazolesuccinocarboxamide synthase [Coriobacteriales bacterium]
MGLRDDITPSSQGKVRDLYDLSELCGLPDQLLFVASDRISAFDYVLPDAIPFKGEVLTRLSLFWFELLADVVPNHLISADVAALPERFAAYRDELAGRFMLVRRARMFPVECIVRGYLAGSGLAEYQRNGTVCGLALPAGLANSARLPVPIYTPSTKAALGAHDENITFADTVRLLGETDAAALRATALVVYERARDYAAERGIIIADTKFEFGQVASGDANTIILADEALTPDSSRFWPAEGYLPGSSQPSFDKQYLRDWLAANWDRKASPNPPHLPPEVIEATSAKYIQAYELLTGESFVPQGRR